MSSRSFHRVAVESCSAPSVSLHKHANTTHTVQMGVTGCVTTFCVFQDVAARGLDLPQVTWIVQVTTQIYTMQISQFKL